MQTLEIISINIWQILISLCNLVILFLLIKKFLYKPVRKMLAKRQAELDERYKNAEDAEKNALKNKEEWEQKIETVQDSADEMIKKAKKDAEKQSDKIIANAKDKADDIVRQAQTDAQLERQKAEDSIKNEIVDVSTRLTEKMLTRKLDEDEHHNLINAFIEELGDDNDGNE